ncbi:conserved hypothetical protein [Sphingobacterium sp. PM2-P1-29]|nr:conserved hypothetical protein [Sphingobacterium sp. PM2-P1-29]
MRKRDAKNSQTTSSNKTCRFELRLSQLEREHFIALEKALGMNRSEIVRLRVLSQSSKVLVNAREVLGMLDLLGTELGRSGNNINQLARHANILNKQGRLTPADLGTLAILLSDYIEKQRLIEKELRSLMRLIKGQK